MKRVSDQHIQRMKQGDLGAFEDIVSWYSPGVLRLSFLLLQDRDEAEDVLQESLLKLVNRIKSGTFANQNGSVKGFLLKCARNHCIDLLRKRNRLSSLDLNDHLAEVIPAPGNNPWNQAKENALHHHLDKAISQLSVQQRTILVLFEVNDESYEEIANTLQIQVETVRKSLYRTRKKLRAILEPCRGEI